LRAAAREFDIPYTTLNRHYQAKLNQTCLHNQERMPSLSREVENEVATVARGAATRGFGLQREELKTFIGEFDRQNWESETQLGHYLRNYCQFSSPYRLPSDNYITKFLQEHSLSLLNPTGNDKRRLDTASDPFLFYSFYESVEEEIIRLGMENSPKSIYNLDETCFLMDPCRGRIVSGRGEPARRIVSCHTTHRLQPLDISCFKPLKAEWNKPSVKYQGRISFEVFRKLKW
jgi:hypothetical protein